ncbi:energy transducer TonB [Desulfovibrio intestinalis]|uniref:Protein TonB n=1 Tax=Desulfovibrio intestinalis TaxID=58621 RepID=A0A7W8C1Q8_9BACT|nr:energy transducer TonB [Desulfovibrio intestinalis]MBB5143686.1 protein TonB [Desulfovibrio intestinalis]
MAELLTLPEQVFEEKSAKTRGLGSVLCSLCLHTALVGTGLAFFYEAEHLQMDAHHVTLVDAFYAQGTAVQKTIPTVKADSAVEPVAKVRHEPKANDKALPIASKPARASTEEKSIPISAKKRKKDSAPSEHITGHPNNEARKSPSFSADDTERATETTGTASAGLPAQDVTARQTSGPQAISAGEYTAYQAGTVDSPPAITKRVAPQYPSSAKHKRIQGSVVVKIIVDTSGLPQQCTVVSAKPEGYFEEASLEAAQRLRFKPGKIKGIVANTVVLLPFDFRLQ